MEMISKNVSVFLLKLTFHFLYADEFQEFNFSSSWMMMLAPQMVLASTKAYAISSPVVAPTCKSVY